MKITKKLKCLLEKLSDNAMRARELNQQIQEEFEKMGLNTDSEKFVNAFGYVEGDGDIDPIIDYIESEDTE